MCERERELGRTNCSMVGTLLRILGTNYSAEIFFFVVASDERKRERGEIRTKALEIVLRHRGKPFPRMAFYLEWVEAKVR